MRRGAVMRDPNGLAPGLLRGTIWLAAYGKIRATALMALLINGELVDDSVVRQETNSLRQQFAGSLEGDPVEIEMRLREQARVNVIDRVLMRQEAAHDPAPLDPVKIEEAQTAVKAGCDPRANDDELRREIEARLRVERLIEKIGSRLARPRPKDVGEF